MRVPGHYRSWDLNKICYKSGVPLIENGMIERVSTLAETLWEAAGAPQGWGCWEDCRGYPRSGTDVAWVSLADD